MYMNGAVLLCLAGAVWAAPRPPCSNEFVLNIMHINDFHSNFQGITNSTSQCQEKDRTANKCYGGVAKLVSMVKQIRKEDPEALLLSGGDNYQGSIWYTLLKAEPVIRFMNMLNFTAMSFGNHEFDDGIDGLVPFLNRFNSELICANIDVSQEPEMQGKFKKSIIKRIQGRKVGFIGYLTPTTKTVSRPGKIKFLDIIKSVRREARRLRRERVKIIIAVGHAGVEVDQQIAKEIPQVDIVVGGHTDTLMYNGDPPVGPKKNVLPYPIVINGGRRHSMALVVQDYAHAAYLGYLSVSFNKRGNIVGYSGDPILLDSSVKDDEEAVREINNFLPALDKAKGTVVGEAAQDFVGTRKVCRSGQCSMGLFVADSFLQYFKSIDENLSKEPTLAVMNAGGIRGSILKGTITFADILGVLPFSGNIERARMKGSLLRQIFEHNVGNYEADRNKINDQGRFLQVSEGVKVVYNMQAPQGSRVSKLSVSFNGEVQPVQNDQFYNVITGQYLINGGDEYAMFAQAEKFPLATYKDAIAMQTNIKAKSPISPTEDNRIFFLDENGAESTQYHKKK